MFLDCIPSFLRRWFNLEPGVSACDSKALFHCEYEPATDLLMVWCGDPQPAENVEVEPDLFVRIHPGTHEVIGIEVIGCAARFHKHPRAITTAFARDLLQKYGPPALAMIGDESTVTDPQLPLFAGPR